MGKVSDAYKNLRNCQKQLDADGRHVGVSRQALDEVLNAFDLLVNSDDEDKRVTYELFNDGPNRWVLTQNYDEDHAPVLKSVQDAFNFVVGLGEPFKIVVHASAETIKALEPKP